MPGVERDGDIEREFESGAPKSKRKAVFERKNLELSGSLVIF
jgi:hypothetical protein